MQDFMKDRYGVDDLSCALGALGVVLTLVGTIFNLRAVSIVALAILIVALLRSFSKNRDARRGENAAFRRMMAKLPIVGERFGSTGSGYRGGGSSRGGAGSAEQLKRQARTAKRCGRSARRKPSSSAPTAGRCSRFPAAKGRSSSPALSATHAWKPNRSIRRTAFANRDASIAGAGTSGAGLFRLPAPDITLTVTMRPPASLRLAVLDIHLISLFSTLPHPCTLLRLPVFRTPNDDAPASTSAPTRFPHSVAFSMDEKWQRTNCCA